MSGFTSFAQGFMQGREQRRVRTIEDEERARRQAREDEQLAAWRDDRAFQSEERQHQRGERDRVAGLRRAQEEELGMAPEVFAARQQRVEHDRGETARAEIEKLTGYSPEVYEFLSAEEDRKMRKALHGAQIKNQGLTSRAAEMQIEDAEQQRMRRRALDKAAPAIMGFVSTGDVSSINEMLGADIYVPDEGGGWAVRPPDGKAYKIEDKEELIESVLASIDPTGTWTRYLQQQAARAEAEAKATERNETERGRTTRALVTAAGPMAASQADGIESLVDRFHPRAGLSGAPANGAPYPEGDELIGPGGKTYIVRNGVPVPK
jgi:hypothetical protein